MWVKQENCNNRHKKVINGTIVQLEDKELEQNKESEQIVKGGAEEDVQLQRMWKVERERNLL